MSGPLDHDGYKLNELPDGRFEHTFRQSTLNELDDCLEKGRRTLHGTLPRWETDAACIGTAMHSGIEAAIEERLHDGTTMTRRVCQEIAQREFDDLIVHPDFRWIQTDEPRARILIDKIVGNWWDIVFPVLAPVATEIGFKGLLLTEDEHRVIRLNGTIDYLDANTGLVDWKSANQEYKAWEKERWAIQPTVYTFAAVQMGLVAEHITHVPFTYVVMNKKGSNPVDWVTVERHVGDWEWLKTKATSIAVLLEAELPEWPRNDNHALCSPKWCPAWDDCKGKHFSDSWPRPTNPSVGASADGGTKVSINNKSTEVQKHGQS